MNPIITQDGDTIVVIAKTQAVSVDPGTYEFPYISQTYRVVADNSGSTLALVPLGRSRSVSDQEAKQYQERLKREKYPAAVSDRKEVKTTGMRSDAFGTSEMAKALPIIIRFMNNPDFAARIKDQGYEFDAVAIFKAFSEASGWTCTSDFIRDVKDKDVVPSGS